MAKVLFLSILLLCLFLVSCSDNERHVIDGREVSREEFDQHTRELNEQANQRVIAEQAAVSTACVAPEKVKEYCHTQKTLVEGSNFGVDCSVKSTDSFPFSYIKVLPIYNGPDASRYSASQVRADRFVQDLVDWRVQVIRNLAQYDGGEGCNSIPTIPIAGLGDEAVIVPVASSDSCSDTAEQMSQKGYSLYVRKGEKFVEFYTAAELCSIEDAKALMLDLILPQI